MKNKIIKFIQIFSIGAVIVSCQNGSDMNQDPNSFYSAVPSSLVTNAQKGIGDYLSTPSVNTNNCRLIMQYWQETTYVDESNYDFVSRNISNSVWNNYYINVLQNLVQAKKIINAYQPTPSETATWPTTMKNQLATIDVMQVFVYQNLVDTFGDIPYQTSNDITANQLPAYSKGTDVYTNLISRLQTDISNLDATGSAFDTGDVFYGGNVAAWKKFANSLLLKLGITIADVNPTLAQSTVNTAIVGGVMASSADDCLMNYESTSPNYSTLYANLVASNRNDYVAAKTVIDYMNASSDPRRSSYFVPVSGTTYVGATIGAPASFTSRSHVGSFAYTATTPSVILNYTEVAFYLAEAAARWNAGAAAAAYATAVTASFTQWGYTGAQATTYLAAKPYVSATWKKSIGEQSWIANYNQPTTSWNTWRRLDYPVLVAPATAVSQAGGMVPVRLTYPVKETTTNPSNYAAASTSIGGDKLTTKLFWDIY